MDLRDLQANGVAVVDRSDRVRIEVTGPDRAKVLHNLTTNEVKRLEPGRGCEAFVTSGQGKTLAWVTIHNDGDRLLLRSDPGTAESILGHLAKYGMFDDATFRDVSGETAEWHVVGIDRTPDLGPVREELDGHPLVVIPERPTGRPGVTILASKVDTHAILGAGSPRVLTSEAFEALRIEAGTPLFGREVTPSHLPQEVGRDARAISFVKGCYLGQETVARLDALGHVNKILIGGLADDSAIPRPGARIQAEGKDVGLVTSSAFSEGWGRGIVLGYVKVASAVPGTRLTAVDDAGSIGLTVRVLPMRPE